ncbi:MAG: TIGR02444 family protein [Shewanella sp.]
MLDTPPLESQLWDWCDNHYGANQALCLELQDKHQVNVNLLLLANYLDSQVDGAKPRCYSTPQWQSLQGAARQWDEPLLIPFRRLRRLAKASLAPDEYQHMLEVELMLERKAQGAILRAIQGLRPEGGPANLVTYLNLFGFSAQAIAALPFAKAR